MYKFAAGDRYSPRPKDFLIPTSAVWNLAIVEHPLFGAGRCRLNLAFLFILRLSF